MKKFLSAAIAATALIASAQSPAMHDPAHALADDSLLQNPAELPIAASRTSIIYQAQQGVLQFNLASYAVFYKGKFWAMWSAGKVNEDDLDQRIMYATSPDGHTWSTAKILIEGPYGDDGLGTWISRSLYVQNGHLYALAAHAITKSPSPAVRDGHKESWKNLKLVRFEWTGKGWKNRGTYLDNCMNNFPPRKFGDHLFMTCRDSFTRMHTAVSSNLQGTDWQLTPIGTPNPATGWMSEPSWYIDPQGTGHLLFRDGGKGHYLYQAISADQGKTWTAPVRTNYPDATSKNFSWRLSNGWYYIINNSDKHKRDPLTISFSRDGWTFEHPMILVTNTPALRFPGHAKGAHSAQYAYAMEHAGSLWVIYSINKEDIAISEFKLNSFHLTALK